MRALEEPLRIGDVVILPGMSPSVTRECIQLMTVTGFSPGVGNFGSKQPWGEWTVAEIRGVHADIADSQAMVQHGFRGSWKSDKDPK